jgi:NADH-quinone oxidoreductase subunit H
MPPLDVSATIRSPGSRAVLVRAQDQPLFFMFAMVKAFVPRYRYDQLMRLGWKMFLPISLGMLVSCLRSRDGNRAVILTCPAIT